MGYQPEERYWTDYLRIALPVVGLLLMLGLFWFWAASLIGDEDDDSPGNLAANTPVATATSPAADTGPTQVPGATDANETPTTPADSTDTTAGGDADPADPGTDETEPAAEEEPDAPADDASEPEREPGEFIDGDTVTTNTGEVRLRGTAEILDDNILDTLAEGTELVVVGDPEEDADGTVWIPVELGNDPDVSGYVAADLLGLSE